MRQFVSHLLPLIVAIAARDLPPLRRRAPCTNADGSISKELILPNDPQNAFHQSLWKLEADRLPKLPLTLDRAIGACLQHDPAKRPGSARDMWARTR